MINKERLTNCEGKIWINVASSTNVLSNFINLDNHLFIRVLCIYPVFKKIIPIKYRAIIEKYIKASSESILLQHDCRKPLPFKDQSADHILCSHFLEHVYVSEAKKILRDFNRVLKNGGTIHIVVPDLKMLVDKYIQQFNEGYSCASIEFLYDTLLVRENAGSIKFRLLELYGGFGLQHKFMYDNLSIKLLLEEAGFKVVDINETPSKSYRLGDDSVHVVAYKDNAPAPVN